MRLFVPENYPADILTRPIRLLMADDEPAYFDILKEDMARANIEPTYVESADAAFMELQVAQHPFDILLTDYRMPGRTGLDLAMVLMRGERPFLPIVLWSSFFPEDAVEFINKVDQYSHFFAIEKPCANAKLIEIIKELVANWRTKRMFSKN